MYLTHCSDYTSKSAHPLNLQKIALQVRHHDRQEQRHGRRRGSVQEPCQQHDGGKQHSASYRDLWLGLDIGTARRSIVEAAGQDFGLFGVDIEVLPDTARTDRLVIEACWLSLSLESWQGGRHAVYNNEYAITVAGNLRDADWG